MLCHDESINIFWKWKATFLVHFILFLYAGVGANHLIIPVNTPHLLAVVIYKLELSEDIAMSVMLSGIDNICLVDC